MLKRNLLFAAATILVGATTAHAAFVINEIDSDQVGTDTQEFVELKGNPNESVNGLTLVFYNGGNSGGQGVAYFALDLVGNANAEGYFVIGNVGVAGANMTFNNNFLQNGEDAVAIYTGRPASGFVVSGPSATPVDAVGLVDFIVYAANGGTPANWDGFGQPVTVYNENEGGQGTLRSLGRIPDGTGPFESINPSPGAVNVSATVPSVALNTQGLNYGTYNASNAGSPATRTVRLTNSGGGTLNVTTFGLGAGAPSVYTISSGPTPALPAALAFGEFVEIQVAFENGNTASDQVFTTTIDYATDAPVNGTGSIPVNASFVTIVDQPAVGSIVVNEIAYDPLPPAPAVGVDYNGDGIFDAVQDEFMEVYNTTGSPINMQGWEIIMISGSGPTVDTIVVPAGVVVPANGHVVFFGGGTPTGFAAGTAYVGIPALGNSGEQIFLFDGIKNVDAVSYGAEQSVDGAPVGVGVASDGGSVGREFDGAPTWIEFVHDSITSPPTPGTSNGAPPLAVPAANWTLFQ